MTGQRAPGRPRKKRRLLRGAILVVIGTAAAAAGALWLTLPDVSGLAAKNPDSTSLIRQRLAAARAAGLPAAPEWSWVAFDRVPTLLKRCVLVSEDAAFYDHKGIDFAELKASLKRDLKEGRLARGGSTITQQLAKNLYLSERKSFVRKIREALIARRLEKTLTKARIFHLYLNVIELGPLVFGVQAGARHWFGKDVEELTLEEMVRLTAVIPRPLRSDPRRNDAWMRFKGRWIADTLLAVKAIGEEGHAALVLAFE